MTSFLSEADRPGVVVCCWDEVIGLWALVLICGSVWAWNVVPVVASGLGLTYFSGGGEGSFLALTLVTAFGVGHGIALRIDGTTNKARPARMFLRHHDYIVQHEYPTIPLTIVLWKQQKHPSSITSLLTTHTHTLSLSLSRSDLT
jgi:hypothetical protein